MATNPQIFNPANKAIVEDVKTELRLQGHYLTGALEASIRERELHEKGGVTLTAEALEYIEDLEKFTPEGSPKFLFSDDQFNKLKKWVILRGLASFDHEATHIAAAIVSKWKREGRPTSESVAFSETGRRTEAIKITFDKNEPKYISMIDEPVINSLDNIFHEIKSGTV